VTRYAAIDCGTNAIRLLIADVVDGRLTEVDRRMLTVRLGEGIDATGEFSSAALERTFAAVEDYAQEIDRFGVRATRMVATSASRDARNASLFIDGVRRRLGIDPEVVAGTEEAELSFIGAVRGLSASLLESPILISDIGGGSTEFVLGDAVSGVITSMCSVDVGCVRMTERHLHDDPPTAEQVDLTVRTIDGILDLAFDQVDVTDIRTFVGLAGSVTTVAALAHALPAYDSDAIHGSLVTLAQVERVTERLLGMTRAQRAAEPVMHPGRVDVIAGGALVLRQIMRRLPIGFVIASETDLLDGIVYRLSEKVS
jgi:exopolyphosphatase / guanosine-5'-triphosphate,3'-diphosphate pyrophosphatase